MSKYYFAPHFTFVAAISLISFECQIDMHHSIITFSLPDVYLAIINNVFYATEVNFEILLS